MPHGQPWPAGCVRDDVTMLRMRIIIIMFENARAFVCTYYIHVYTILLIVGETSNRGNTESGFYVDDHLHVPTLHARR